MNQKPLKYILVTALCLVWGVIFYKVLAALNDPNEVSTLAIKSQVETNYITIKDSFSLLADYNDPFLWEDSIESEVGIAADTIQHTIITPAPAVAYGNQAQKEDLSFIQYLGSIYNSDEKSRTAIINVRGKEILIKGNETIEEIKIKSINADHVIIIHKGQKYIIYKHF